MSISNHSALFRLIVVVVGAAVVPPTVAAAQDEERSTTAARVDFKVVAWFKRSQPIATFQYQVYDLRKGDWTPAVDEWLELLRTTYPDFKVVVRDVDLTRENGPTERRKVGSVVHRELLAAAAEEGVFLTPGGSARGVIARQPLTTRLTPIEHQATGPYLPAIPMMFPMNAAPMGFPVPMPYSRPHP